jgi:hypothetical protein
LFLLFDILLLTLFFVFLAALVSHYASPFPVVQNIFPSRGFHATAADPSLLSVRRRASSVKEIIASPRFFLTPHGILLILAPPKDNNAPAILKRPYAANGGMYSEEIQQGGSG